MCVYVYVYGMNMDLLEWLTVIGPACPTMTVSQRTGHDSLDSLVQEAGCLSWYSVCVIVPRKWVLMQRRNASAAGEMNLASESEGKQARSESFLLPCPFMGCH